jgi:hypothetical protein
MSAKARESRTPLIIIDNIIRREAKHHEKRGIEQE